MNPIPENPFHSPQDFPLPPGLQELARPTAEVLADFMHACSPAPQTRTAATTALVLSLWQLGGRKLTSRIPSLLLIHPEGNGADPVDDFVRTLVHDEKENEPRVQTEGLFSQVPISRAPQAMRNAVLERRKLGRQIPPGNGIQQLGARASEEKFRTARVTGHGYGRSRAYSKAWHPEYGLLTDSDDQLILRLNHEEDRSGFCHDLFEEPGKILFPEGLGADLFPVAKTLSVSGALASDLRTEKLVRCILVSGMPFFVLPHVADSPLESKGLHALRCFAMIWRSTPLPPVEADLCLPASDWVRRYHLTLSKHLAAFPLSARFPALQAIHQLEEVCRRIVGVACDGTTTEEQALLHDLFHHTLRGLVIGIASQTWFGIGLMPGEEQEGLRKKAARLLRRLRDEGPVTKTELLKNLLRNKRDRDAVVEALTDRGLIRVEGDTVAATSYREFVEGLYASEEFPAVESQWEGVSGKERAEDREAV